jgi:hypothetical protein
MTFPFPTHSLWVSSPILPTLSANIWFILTKAANPDGEERGAIALSKMVHSRFNQSLLLEILAA